MTTTISRSSDATTSAPSFVMGYETTRTAQNIFTPLIDGTLVVTAIPPKLRSGTLNLFYPSESAAWTAYAYFAVATRYRIVETTGASAVGMYFYTEGDITIQLDPETLTQWTVAVGYQEVLP